MKIAISATGTDLQAQVDGRFGRCQHFIIYDTEAKTFEAITNEAQFASGGAGIQAGQTVQKSGAQVVLTGNVGPNAIRTLGNIKVCVGVSGTVSEAIRKYEAGEYQPTEEASVKTKFGMDR